MRIAVFGASGVIGSALLPELAKNHELLAFSRRPHVDEGGVRWVVADAMDESSLGALEGIDVVVYLVHSLGSRGFEAVDRTAAENVARAAGRARLRQIVYLGGLGDDGPDLSAHLRSRHETAAALAAGPVPVTTLRAAMVVGRGSAAFETILALVDRLPLMICPRWVSVPTQPIALCDIVAYLCRACGNEATYGRSFDVGGPEVMTYREMIEAIARIRGKRPRILEVPVLTPRLSSWWLHLVTPVNAAVARPLIDGLRSATVVRDEAIRDLIPIELTRFDDAVRAALAAG
ncbi:MAG TPA: NAD(P)H-binding protein [Gaiellaceae bacterium]|nr:NAD(P)H-binding protein [Gaiellaceae bacterium]